MTEMAIYEKHEGNRDRRIDSYFKADYISSQLLKSFLCATFAGVIVAGIYAIYNFEELMLEIYSMDIVAFLKGGLLYYAVFLIFYLALTAWIYSRRYDRMRRNLREYYRDLKELSAYYEEDGEQ